MVALWVIKSNPSTSIGFPVMLVVICAIRKFMECIFTKRELRLLDDLLPESDENVRKGNLSNYSFQYEVCRSKGSKVTLCQTLRMIQTRSRTWADWFEWGRGQAADFFLRPLTLRASNFEAL